MSVRANDKDLPTSENGMVRYHLGGEYSNLFTIDPISGEIKVSGNGVIDREKTPFLKLMVFASDMPQGGPHQKMSSVPVINFINVGNIQLFYYCSLKFLIRYKLM